MLHEYCTQYGFNVEKIKNVIQTWHEFMQS